MGLWTARSTWLALLGAVIAGLLVAWLLYPAPIVPRTVEVPALRGRELDGALTDLAELGLRGRQAGELDDPLVPIGRVSWQLPVEGTRLPEGAVVRLGISSGPPRVVIPDLVDLDLVTVSG